MGGGAFLDWRANGSLLDNRRPQANLTGWEVSGKDHFFADPSRSTAYAMLLDDPNNLYQVVMVQQASPIASHPTARATLPTGSVMTGATQPP